MQNKPKGRNEGKPAICRIASLSAFGGVILGRDMGGIFKEGHVYSAYEVNGEIVLTDLGEHAQDEFLGKRGRISQYATSGVHCLTNEEYKIQLSLKQ